MQLKTMCQSCENDLSISKDEMFEGIYKKAGEVIEDYINWYEIKSGGWFGCDKSRAAVQRYRLLEDIKLKYFTCLCGEMNYLKKPSTRMILCDYKTEKMNLELLEWKTDHDSL